MLHFGCPFKNHHARMRHLLMREIKEVEFNGGGLRLAVEAAGSGSHRR